MRGRDFVIAGAIVVAVACVLGGCGGSMQVHQSNALVSGRIKIGMKRDDVVWLLGSPQRTETKGPTEFLFYTPVWYVSPLLVKSQNPVAIRDGLVVGLGQSYYDVMGTVQASK